MKFSYSVKSGRTYGIILGFDGTKHFAWNWTPDFERGFRIYRVHPFTFVIIECVQPIGAT